MGYLEVQEASTGYLELQEASSVYPGKKWISGGVGGVYEVGSVYL